MQITEEKAQKYLCKDRLLYADMLDCIRLGKAKILSVASNAVLIEDVTCGICAFAAEDEDSGRRALRALDKNFGGWIVAHGEEARAAVYATFPIKQETKTLQVVYLQDAVEYTRTLTFRFPDENQLQIIKDNYDRESPENIQGIFERRELFVALKCENGQEKFVGFIGFHPEGSMGLLYIFPEYRRKGYAEETESFLMEECLKRGKIPYGHVVFGNEASMRLQKKLGFEQASQYVYWLRR
ncbi:MAG: GNAT family N-acetyltransferase [Clostridia bacterium]|nr:GNAT family N-acetyltransferase [Clostridia bacterium]